MKKASAVGLIVVAAAVAYSGWLHAQTQVRVDGPAVRFSITSTSEATILLDATTGETWVLNVSHPHKTETVWLPIRRPSEDLTQRFGQATFLSGWARLSPFTKVECLPDDKVRVQFEGENYELVAMDNLSTSRLLNAARNAFNERWEKRFVEDIVEVMEAAGKRPGGTVKLVLKDAAGELVTVAEAPMTSQNRQAAWLARNQSYLNGVTSVNPFFSGVPGYPKWSAFTGIKWKDDKPSVEIAGKWYELLKFHGVSVDELRQACAKNGWPFQHRFTEDLVQIVRIMGHEIDRKTELELRDEKGAIITMKNVEMNEANQRQLLRSR